MAGSGTVSGNDLDEVVPSPDLDRARDLVSGFGERPGYVFSTGEVLANLRALHVVAGAVEAAKLGLVAELDARAEAVGGGGWNGSAVTFLTEGLHLSRRQARRDVAAAHAVHAPVPDLPGLGRALAEGEVSREH